MRTGEKPWRKIWRELWSPTSTSLASLRYDELYVFVVILVHASWTAGDTDGHLQAASLARICRMRPARVRKTIETLQKVGAISVENGVILVPNYSRWQESKDAGRKRKERSEKKQGESDIPRNVPSVSVSVSDLDQIRSTVSPETAVHTKVDIDQRTMLSSWARKGGDPDGLGPWPDTKTPSGMRVRRLAYTTGAAARISEGYTARELHSLVHDLAKMVGDGSFDPKDYRSEYVFSGWISRCMQEVEKWRSGKRSTGNAWDLYSNVTVVNAGEEQ